VLNWRSEAPAERFPHCARGAVHPNRQTADGSLPRRLLDPAKRFRADLLKGSGMTADANKDQYPENPDRRGR
jgi:hypothetical protein